MIDIHPLCSNSRNEMCNITVNYFITFKIIRGFIHKDGVQETLNKQTKCPLENYNICLQYAIHAMSWLSDVTYYTNYPNIYAMTASDPNYRFYIFLIVVIVLFSCLELLCLWMCCCNIGYY